MSLLFFGDSFGHANGTGGADKTAEVAAYALCADDAGLACIGVEVDSLMAAIHAGSIAASATYTFFAVKNVPAVYNCVCTAFTHLYAISAAYTFVSVVGNLGESGKRKALRGYDTIYTLKGNP